MKLLHYVVYMSVFPLLIACSGNTYNSNNPTVYQVNSGSSEFLGLPVVLGENNGVETDIEDISSSSNSYRSKYKRMLFLRKKLMDKGLDYRPWESHLNNDLILMERLNSSLSKGELDSYDIKEVAFISTKGGTYIHKTKPIIFVNYKWSLGKLKTFLENNKHKFSKTVSSSVLADLNQEPEPTPKTVSKRKKISQTLVENHTIDYRPRARYIPNQKPSSTALAEAVLENELYSISYDDCPVVYEYVVYPTSNGKIVINHKMKVIYIDTRAISKQIVEACK